MAIGYVDNTPTSVCDLKSHFTQIKASTKCVGTNFPLFANISSPIHTLHNSHSSTTMLKHYLNNCQDTFKIFMCQTIAIVELRMRAYNSLYMMFECESLRVDIFEMKIYSKKL